MGHQTLSYHHDEHPVDGMQTVVTRTDYDAEGRVVHTYQYRLAGTLNFNHADELDSEAESWKTSTTYTPNGQEATTTDRFGTLTDNTYDARGNLVQSRTRTTDDEQQNERWLTTRTAFDENGRSVATMDQFLTDAAGQRTTAIEDLRLTHTLYDARGRAIETRRVKEVEITLDTSGDQPEAVFDDGYAPSKILSFNTTAYDDAGQVRQTVNEHGAVTDHEYDAAGNQVAVVGPEVDDPDEQAQGKVRLRTEYVFDPAGRQTEVITNIKVKENDEQVRDKAAQTQTVYDKAGRAVAELSAQFDDPDEAGLRVRHRRQEVYDVRGRRVSVTDNIRHIGRNEIDHDSARATRYAYDHAGRLTAVILPAVVDADSGTLLHPRYEYEYDAHGNQTLIRDNVAQDPETGAIDASSARETKFSFDALGQQIKRELPEGLVETFDYNALGQQVRHVDFQGRVKVSVYGDAEGERDRLVEQRYFTDEAAYDNGNGTAERTITFGFDAFGRRTKVIDSEAGTWEYEHDAEGRLAKETDGNGHTVSYEHDDLGQLTQIATADSQIDYSYDDLGRLETVTRGGTAITTYVYDLVGNQMRVEHPNDMFSHYEYDERNILTSLVHEKLVNEQPVEIARFDYALNLDGSRRGVKQVLDKDFVNEQNDLVTDIAWGYDAANRLTEETYASDAVSYAADYHFDLVGNRKIMGDKMYEYDAADRIEQEQDPLASRLKLYSWEQTEQTGKATHDGLSDTDPLLEAMMYLYDLRGRMSRVEIDETGDEQVDVTVEYLYNPDGIRVSKAVGSDSRHYVIATHNPTGYAQVLEEHVNGNLDRAYTIGHTVLGQDDGTDELTFLVDGHNSTMALVDEQGDLDQRFAYDAYGNLLDGQGLTSASAAKASHLYTGEDFDADAQMQYLRARWYDPANGRFNRLDPFAGNPQDPQSLHKYLYAHANPVTTRDPLGLFALAGLAKGLAVLGSVVALSGLGMMGFGILTGRPALRDAGLTVTVLGANILLGGVALHLVAAKYAVEGIVLALIVAGGNFFYVGGHTVIRQGFQEGQAESALRYLAAEAEAQGERVPQRGVIVVREHRQQLRGADFFERASRTEPNLRSGDLVYQYRVGERSARHVSVNITAHTVSDSGELIRQR